MHVRESEGRDLPAIADIYGHWVRFGLGTFEYDRRKARR